MTYEVEKVGTPGMLGARLFIEVDAEGVVTSATSPTHGCFDATFIGDPWSTVRRQFESQGFTVRTGA